MLVKLLKMEEVFKMFMLNVGIKITPHFIGLIGNNFTVLQATTSQLKHYHRIENRKPTCYEIVIPRKLNHLQS